MSKFFTGWKLKANMAVVTSHFVILVTLCNNYSIDWLKTRDLGSRTLDLGLSTLDSNFRTQKPRPGSKIHDPNLDPGPKICNDGLGFVLHTVWRCLTLLILVVWKYSLQSNIDVTFNISRWRFCGRV